VISACETLRQSDISSLPVQYSLLLQRYIAQSLRWAGDYSTSINVAAAAFDESLRIGLMDEAAMIALQTAFTYLDLAKPEEALPWIEKAAFNSPAPRSHERTIALRHAQSRFLLQTSQWAEAYELLLLPNFDTIQSDQTLRRRIAETSCIAFAASKCGMTEVAIRCFESCLDFLRSDPPSLQSDFPISALYRTLMVLGKESEAKDFLMDYCHRRANTYQRPVAPHFAEISAELRMLTLN
jgi:tetratricopeptide (TPR) repeat protein